MNDSTSTSSNGGETLPTYTEEYLDKVAGKISDYGIGIKCAEKYILLKKYKRLFSGKAAVEWVMNREKCTSEAVAVHLLQQLYERNAFFRLGAKRNKDSTFQGSSSDYYQFVDRKRIVIVGGGFAGCRLAKKLDNDFNVILIDKRGYFECLPSLPTLLTDPDRVDKIRSPLATMLNSGRLLLAEVSEVTPTHVLINDGTDKLWFDYLVLCTGSRYNIPFSSPRIVNCISSESVINAMPLIHDAKYVTVVGTGPVGIEIAGELVCKYPEKRIRIISATPSFLERCCKAAHANVYRFFSQYPNVQMIFSERVSEITEDGVITTSTGRKIPSDVVFCCIGFIPNTEYMQPQMSQCLSSANRSIIVNEALQVVGFNNIYACGDITAIREEKLAQTADCHADIVYQNIVSVERGNGVLTPYRAETKKLIITLGPSNAILVNGDQVMMESVIIGKMKGLVEYKIMRNVK